MKQSNHPILLSVLKPIVVMRFRDVLAKTLAEQIRVVLETADSIAWDVKTFSATPDYWGCRLERLRLVDSGRWEDLIWAGMPRALEL